jgi:hypothetical protein
MTNAAAFTAPQEPRSIDIQLDKGEIFEVKSRRFRT